jgi:hypothetical protein
MRIQDFKTFNEAKQVTYEGVDLPESVVKLLIDFSTRRLFSQFIGTPWFGGLRLSEESADGQRILLTFNGITEPLPFIRYTGDQSDVFYGGYSWDQKSYHGIKVIDIDNKEEKSQFDRLVTLGWIPENEIYQIRRRSIEFSPGYIYYLFNQLLSVFRHKGEKFNIFDHDFMSLPEMQDLVKMGASVVSTPIERKNGTLTISHPSLSIPIQFQASGYIRRKGVSGYVSTKPELIKPINKLEDIVPKLIYLRFMILKDGLEKSGLSTSTINSVIKMYIDNPSNYSDYVKDMVKKYPTAALYLPAPDEGFDSRLIGGAKLMQRFGIFG